MIEGDCVMCLFPQAFSLIFCLEFFKKCREAFSVKGFESVLAAKIKVVLQPLQIITRSIGPNPFLLYKICKSPGDFNRNLKHGDIILFQVISKDMYDIQLEADFSG